MEAAVTIHHGQQEGGSAITEGIVEVKVGHQVPDFELKTYNPVTHDFETVTLADQKKAGKWTILFFYPADFTFV
jgi:peroxiredoxin (alkyl hydroperoxide reductase subunit C)